MAKLPKFVNQEEALKIFKNLGREFVIVQNPSYIHPDFEFYPLAPKVLTPRTRLSGIVKDMDGTTTTTEELCLHSLEYMVKRVTGLGDKQGWALDKKKDYPHIIGNSTTRHVEYLIETYGSKIIPGNFKRSYIAAALWTLSAGKDEGRRLEVRKNLINLGWNDILKDKNVKEIISSGRFDPEASGQIIEALLSKYGKGFQPKSFTDQVRAAIDIYYWRYHEILTAIDNGEGEQLSRELTEGRRLIEPMPFVGVFLSLIKGWLGDDLELFYDDMAEYLISHPQLQYKTDEIDRYRSRVKPLSEIFTKQPLKVAVVTSSIAYEARIVLKEVFNVVCGQIEKWPVKDEKKAFLIDKFRSLDSVYDAFITATDSNEIRLKPHRDLYSIALHQLGIPKEEFNNVIGFEDSESGTIAIRAAGIGLCAAVPFTDTAGHDLSASAYILNGGLAEAILIKNLFL